MNKYFKSIGFCQLDTKIFNSQIIKDILINPDLRNILQSDNDTFFEYYKYYNNIFGLSLKGSMFDLEGASVKNITPFVTTDNYINVSNYTIVESDSYCIMNSNENETGNDLSFYLHNYVDYYNNKFSSTVPSINVVGLSLFGKIIIPISRDEEYKFKKQKEEEKYKNLIKKARSGDIVSEKKLTAFANKTNKSIQERLKEEDFFSVIDGYFLPIKDTIPTYCILGTITEISKIKNPITKELLFLFSLDIKGLELEVCINSKDLIGMPSLGMRFMGQCALQGKIFYN